MSRHSGEISREIQNCRALLLGEMDHYCTGSYPPVRWLANAGTFLRSSVYTQPRAGYIGLGKRRVEEHRTVSVMRSLLTRYCTRLVRRGPFPFLPRLFRAPITSDLLPCNLYPREKHPFSPPMFKHRERSLTYAHTGESRDLPIANGRNVRARSTARCICRCI